MPDETLKSGNVLEVEVPDEVLQSDLSDALFPGLSGAGEDAPFSRPERDVFGTFSAHRTHWFTAPFFPLQFNGTDAELREHLGIAKR